METKYHPDSPTLRKHKRQVIWQILIPVIVVALLVIATAFFITFGGRVQNSLWRDVSLIWLLFPALVFSLTLIFLLAAAIYGLARLLKVAPGFTQLIQVYAQVVELRIRQVADGAARPVIWLDQAGAALCSIFKHRGG